VTLPDDSESRGDSMNPESVDVAAAPRIATTEPSVAAAQPDEATSASPDFPATPETADEQSSSTEAVAAPARPAYFMPSLLVMLAVIVACVTVFLLRRRAKPRAQIVATPAAAEPVTQPLDALELLISGELPMVDEPLQLPYESQIFGRPLEASPYRTDPAQALGGPHYIPQPSPAATAAVVAAEQPPDPASVPAGRKFRVDMRHPRSTASVLDRALATFEGEQP
jgi:hypothetical protein